MLSSFQEPPIGHNVAMNSSSDTPWDHKTPCHADYSFHAQLDRAIALNDRGIVALTCGDDLVAEAWFRAAVRELSRGGNASDPKGIAAKNLPKKYIRGSAPHLMPPKIGLRVLETGMVRQQKELPLAKDHNHFFLSTVVFQVFTHDGDPNQGDPCSVNDTPHDEVCHLLFAKNIVSATLLYNLALTFHLRSVVYQHHSSCIAALEKAPVGRQDTTLPRQSKKRRFHGTAATLTFAKSSLARSCPSTPLLRKAMIGYQFAAQVAQQALSSSANHELADNVWNEAEYTHLLVLVLSICNNMAHLSYTTFDIAATQKCFQTMNEIFSGCPMRHRETDQDNEANHSNALNHSLQQQGLLDQCYQSILANLVSAEDGRFGTWPAPAA
mmetsp:Transcript_33513/g.69755  ORF Transcript_33513/g.69755 Transcript_33513/m.69755 type:complete len:382 (-) Transcript_33513:27-1172(-)